MPVANADTECIVASASLTRSTAGNGPGPSSHHVSFATPGGANEHAGRSHGPRLSPALAVWPLRIGVNAGFGPDASDGVGLTELFAQDAASKAFEQAVSYYPSHLAGQKL